MIRTRLVCAALCIAAIWTTPSAISQEIGNGAQRRVTIAQSETPYYIEFRVATIGTYGHSYVRYGRLNAQGLPADQRYSDLHPRGNYAVMAVGHLLPVPANTRWDPEVLSLPVATSYRRKITSVQYKKLLEAIRKSESDKDRYWNAATNNCNHYVGELARIVGLKTPGNFQVSYTFIPALRDLNEPSKAPTN